MNLVVNARDAMPSGGGTLFVRTSRHTDAAGSRTTLVVQDAGVGMGGRALVERLVAARPTLPVVFMSGDAVEHAGPALGR